MAICYYWRCDVRFCNGDTPYYNNAALYRSLRWQCDTNVTKSPPYASYGLQPCRTEQQQQHHINNNNNIGDNKNNNHETQTATTNETNVRLKWKEKQKYTPYMNYSINKTKSIGVFCLNYECHSYAEENKTKNEQYCRPRFFDDDVQRLWILLLLLALNRKHKLCTFTHTHTHILPRIVHLFLLR